MSKKENSKNEFIKNNDSGSSLGMFLVPISIILSGVLIMVSVLISATAILDRDELVTKSNLNAAITSAISQAGLNTTTANTDTAQPQAFTETSTSIQSDPVKGDKSKVKVAIVEYSDYECPYCHQYYTQTYGQIKTDYIDTGKAVLIFRDNPLYFHEPAASMKAMAAECVNEIGGNAKYYEYHDKLFDNYDSLRNTVLLKSDFSAKVNELYGKASTLGSEEARKQILDIKEARNSQPLKDLAVSIGIDKDKISSCIDSDKFRSEVLTDIEDAAKAGAQGTPGFIIGTLNDKGDVDGKLISGAYPFASFQEVIDEYLNK